MIAKVVTRELLMRIRLWSRLLREVERKSQFRRFPISFATFLHLSFHTTFRKGDDQYRFVGL